MIESFGFLRFRSYGLKLFGKIKLTLYSLKFFDISTLFCVLMNIDQDFATFLKIRI